MIKSIITSVIFLLFSLPLFAIDHLSPITFGANGSDKNDDTKSIQDCINSAKKNKISKIVFDSGTYYIEGTIDLSGINGLIIEGNGATLVKPQGNYTNIIWGEYSSCISISNINFEGNRPDKFEYQWPHLMNACANMGKCGGIHFERCNVKNFWYGVCLGTSTAFSQDIWIKDCVFENCNFDIDLYGKPTIVISGNVSRGCTENSIQIEPAYKKDNTIFNFKDQPNLDALSIGNIITDNAIVDCKGISINIFSGSEDVIIKGNNIINFGKVGVMCTHYGASNIVVANNVISNSTYSLKKERPWGQEGSAIALAGVENVVVNGNVISHANTGINIVNTVGTVINGNKISNSIDAGVSLYSSKLCIVNANNIDNYNLSGSWWASSGIVITKCNNLYISDCIISTKEKNPYAIYSTESFGIECRDIFGIGYQNSVTYPSDLLRR